MTQFPPQAGQFNFDEPQPKRSPRWPWILGIVGGIIILGCVGCFGVLTFIGANAPETSVYTGNRVPQKYIEIMEDVGDLQPGETILFFYSDALMDIKDGFYYVSDQKVVIYSEVLNPPLNVIPFDQIVSVDLSRDTSFLVDSEIYLDLRDGTTFSFPVSSENDGDVKFSDAIEARVN